MKTTQKTSKQNKKNKIEKELEEKLFNLQKNIFNLKVIKASRKPFNYHVIKTTKHEIVQLNYKTSLLKNA